MPVVTSQFTEAEALRTAVSMDTSAVPLMMDMEGGEGEDKRAGVEAGLEGDFAYHNNVAGASKHVRLGGC